MAKEERKILEEIAMDIAKSQYGFGGTLEEYLEARKMVTGFTAKQLVDYITQ